MCLQSAGMTSWILNLRNCNINVRKLILIMNLLLILRAVSVSIWYDSYHMSHIKWIILFQGRENWQRTMNLISKVWIQDAIRPKGSQQCGHHVAGRKFSYCYSSHQVLFYNFTPPNPSGMLWNDRIWPEITTECSHQLGSRRWNWKFRENFF